MNSWVIILVFLAGWLSTLSGVALGGWLVYRTKRDPYEPLFGGAGKGDSFNVDDDFEQVEDVVGTTLPQATEKANDAFVSQFAETLAKSAAGHGQVPKTDGD